MLTLSQILIKVSFLAFALGSAAAMAFPVVSPLLDGIQQSERASAEAFSVCIMEGHPVINCAKE